MAVHKILVEINKGKPVHPTEVSDETTPTEVAPRKETELGRKPGLDALSGAAAFSMAQRMAQGTVARIGEATGDYYQQKLASTGLSIAQYGFAIGRFGLAGAAFTAIDLGYKVYDYNLQKSKQEINVDFYRQSIGAAAISNSRYKGRKI
jgi:hypothetical protein